MARKFDLTEPNLSRKLARFADVARFPNCIEAPDAYKLSDFNLNGRWAEKHFENEGRITLELACGKGEYTVGLAGCFPDRNFIGIDIKGNRIWKGAKLAIEQGLSNAAFLRTRIDHIANLFGKREVEEIWVVFPDPQPKKKGVRKRLTSPQFIDRYSKILSDDGIIQLKTDDLPLFEYTQNVVTDLGLTCLAETTDLYSDLDRAIDPFLSDREQQLRIRTFYEEMWLSQNKKIKYIAFRL